MMGESVPKVSLGLPVYNGSQYLAASIDSLLAQTFADFELIISDNASTDDTESICRRYARQDERIRYYRVEENLGAAWNYNRVFELAQGEYFKWAAHDDIHMPTFLEKTVEVLDRRPEVIWCFGRYSHIGPNGRLVPGAAERDLSFINPNGIDRSSPRPHQRFQAILLSRAGLDIYSLHRREVVAKTVVFPPYYGSEKVFLAELAMLGPYEEIPETLIHFRVHPDASGCLPTESDLQYFIDPRDRRRFAFTRLRLLKGHWQAVHRFPLSIGERVRCYRALLRYLLQFSKWRRVIESIVRRKGTGGGYLSQMQVVESTERPNRRDEIARDKTPDQTPDENLDDAETNPTRMSATVDGKL